MNASRIGQIVAAVVVLALLASSAFTVRETEVVILTQFGRPVGGPVTESGLHWKVPFIQNVNSIEKRVLIWDGKANEMPTKDKTYISVVAFAR